MQPIPTGAPYQFEQFRRRLLSKLDRLANNVCDKIILDTRGLRPEDITEADNLLSSPPKPDAGSSGKDHKVKNGEFVCGDW